MILFGPILIIFPYFVYKILNQSFSSFYHFTLCQIVIILRFSSLLIFFYKNSFFFYSPNQIKSKIFNLLEKNLICLSKFPPAVMLNIKYNPLFIDYPWQFLGIWRSKVNLWHFIVYIFDGNCSSREMQFSARTPRCIASTLHKFTLELNLASSYFYILTYIYIYSPPRS